MAHQRLNASLDIVLPDRRTEKDLDTFASMLPTAHPCGAHPYRRTFDSRDVDVDVLDGPARRFAGAERRQIHECLDAPRQQLIRRRCAESGNRRIVDETNERVGTEDDGLVARAHKVEIARRRIIGSVECRVREMREMIAREDGG